jgi:glycosyltransferase involved in cell wall biosynthesis
MKVLFTTYNRLEYSKIALEALKKTGCEIIVIDNASTDGTQDWLKGQNVWVIYNKENLGVSGAMNQFLEITKNDEYVGKVDNDTVVPKDWAEKTLDILKSNDLDIVQPKHYIIKATYPDGWDGFVKTLPKIGEGLWKSDFVGGSGIVFRRRCVKGYLPKTDWVLGGWNDWQKAHPEVKKAFTDKVEIKLLDEKGYDDYPEYYQKTGRIP